MPVNTIAMPCSSAAPITSSSRTEPPGWTTAAMPASAAASMPSRNGKKASEAITEPFTARPACSALIAAMRAGLQAGGEAGPVHSAGLKLVDITAKALSPLFSLSMRDSEGESNDENELHCH